MNYIISQATLETFIYICLDWLADIITRTAPFQTSIGCRFRPNNYNAIAALCGCTEPLAIWRNPLSPLGYKQKFFQASSGPLGGTEALLESTSEAQGDFPWKSHRLAIRINQKNREYLSHPSFGEINIWNFSLLPVDLSPIFERQLGGCLFTCWWPAQLWGCLTLFSLHVLCPVR